MNGNAHTLVGPRYGFQQHTTEPAQAADFDKVGVRGPDRIAINAFSFDLLATSALDRVIESKDKDTPRDEHGHQESEQETTGLQRRPDGSIEHAMIGLKVGLISEPHDAKNGGDRWRAGGKDGSGDEDFDMLPKGA